MITTVTTQYKLTFTWQLVDVVGLTEAENSSGTKIIDKPVSYQLLIEFFSSVTVWMN